MSLFRRLRLISTTWFIRGKRKTDIETVGERSGARGAEVRRITADSRANAPDLTRPEPVGPEQLSQQVVWYDR